MKNYAMVAWIRNCTLIKMNILILYIVICCIAKCYSFNERTVQTVQGRNVSFSLKFKNINKDSFIIYHDSSILADVWPIKDKISRQIYDMRLQIALDKSVYNTVIVTISIMNITENDAGIYKMERIMDSKKVIDSVHVQVFVTLPWVTMVHQNSSDYTIVLQCSSNTPSTGMFIWKRNGVVLESHGRYSKNNSLLIIRNVTSDDTSSLYTCKQWQSEPESDPFKLTISGPNAVQFAPNVTVAKEYQWINISCLADCYPICTYNWRKVALVSALQNTISDGNELQLRNITRDDAGNYSCKVYNIISDTLLEGITHVDVVYGPDDIYINTSDSSIHLNQNGAIAIFCYANCSPPCTISWTEPNKHSVIPGSELKLTNVENDVNYTCHATNPVNSYANLSETICIRVTSGTNTYKTTAMIPERPKEDFPSSSHISYVVLLVGVILAVGFFACLMKNFRSCSNTRKASNSATQKHSNKEDVDETQEEQYLSGNYWTVVTDESGVMSTVRERDVKNCNTTILKGNVIVTKNTKSQESISVIDVNVDVELDEYMDPIHSAAEENIDYINPVHSGSMNTATSLDQLTTEI